MATIKQKSDKARYWVIDTGCLGRSCLRLGYYESRGATLTGSRNTGNSKPCCLTNAYHGCPYENGTLLPIDPDLINQRKREGMTCTGS